MNILVVDDEKTQIETLRRGLRIRGFTVFEALSGKDALNVINQNPAIDLILTDYAMPEMNGLELLAEIRKTYKNKPAIIMTAYGDKELVSDAMQNRCNGFIDKPFTLDELLEEINRKGT